MKVVYFYNCDGTVTAKLFKQNRWIEGAGLVEVAQYTFPQEKEFEFKEFVEAVRHEAWKEGHEGADGGGLR